VVVKAIGGQIASLRWVTGGTILGDGRVALIADMSALVRSTSRHSVAALSLHDEVEDTTITAMVVDDSITVRKVTARLLERHNIQVITAKDGVDAISILQEHQPDVVLLDIEMPRMDGFELTRHMRNSPDWSDIPIIMISSRVGEKHRKRAFELGVKNCLGKPFQEEELLDNIQAVLKEGER
jgi:chemosensory pili system protein ChpA (sensor histidine kinase/response regulator)